MIIPSTKTTKKVNPQFEKFLQGIKGAKDAYVTIGLHEDAGTYPDADVSVVQVGLWNEFGTETIPERSWLRSTLSDNISEIKAVRLLAIAKMMKGEMDLEGALNLIGFRIQVMVQNKIKSNVAPELSPATAAMKAKKGIAVQTLIQSGLMLRSVTYKVVMG